MKKEKKKKRKKAYGPFTMFSKAVFDHVGLSFSTSGRKRSSNCDIRCRLLELCYAVRIERIYADLERKLERHHRSGAVAVLVEALATLRDDPISWARFSVDGSLPERAEFDRTQWAIFRDLLREFVSRCLALGARWHIPVESRRKARAYRAALSGLGVTIRRSDQSATIERVLSSNDSRSWVACAGELHRGHVSKVQKEANTEYAFECARKAREAGVSTVVCPAVYGSGLCGSCTACSTDRVELVIYPFHG